MAKSILHTIESNMSGFSKGQKRIAGYILENYDKAAFMTASKLGHLVGVSESTVVRFASELGYDGYPSMQRALQEMIRSRLTSTQRIQAAGDMLSGHDVLSAVVQSDMDKLRMMVGEADRGEFDRVVDKIMSARHIYILGVRSSSFVAGYLNFYLHLLSENVTLVQSNAAGEIFEQLLHIGRYRSGIHSCILLFCICARFLFFFHNHIKGRKVVPIIRISKTFIQQNVTAVGIALIHIISLCHAGSSHTAGINLH